LSYDLVWSIDPESEYMTKHPDYLPSSHLEYSYIILFILFQHDEYIMISWDTISCNLSFHDSIERGEDILDLLSLFELHTTRMRSHTGLEICDHLGTLRASCEEFFHTLDIGSVSLETL
jgi:hypothetical protein